MVVAKHATTVIDCDSCARYLLLIHLRDYVSLCTSIYKPLRLSSWYRFMRIHQNRRHHQQHARHDRNQATAHRHRRQLPHLRSQINPGTVLGLTAAFIASLQTAQARKSARKTTKRPKSTPPTTRTPRKKPSHSTPPSTSIATFAVSNQS